jgi:hypothetical protein
MPPRPVCSQLSSGDGAAILVTDFQALNGERRLSQLLSDAAAGERVYQVDPRGAVSGDRLYASLPELAAETAGIFRSSEPAAATDRRVFVVSHCSAAGLSVRIANHLTHARAVTAILVEPTWPGAEDVAGRFAEFQGKLGASSRPCPDLEGDPWTCVAGMEQLMREDLAQLATRLGLDAPPPAFSELLLAYRTWLAYLLACGNDLPATAPSDAVAMSVLTHESDFVVPGTGPGRCRITPPPPADQPDAVTPELVELLLDQIRN